MQTVPIANERVELLTIARIKPDIDTIPHGKMILGEASKGHLAGGLPYFMAGIDAARVKAIFDMAKRYRKPDVPHHGEANDLRRRLELSAWLLHP